MTLDDLEHEVTHGLDVIRAATMRGAFDRYRAANPEPEYVLPTRKTGVIVGVSQSASQESCERTAAELRAAFPNVTLKLVAGGQSVAFEWVEA